MEIDVVGPVAKKINSPCPASVLVLRRSVFDSGVSQNSGSHMRGAWFQVLMVQGSGTDVILGRSSVGWSPKARHKTYTQSQSPDSVGLGITIRRTLG